MEDQDTFLPGQVAINQKKRNNILKQERDEIECLQL